ncbi:IclR family transcriptional regulator [Lutimaribacter sp. EGI FJ00015]|uniref:IclR family transcriptional regulator n=1 Tax=Lutimaribacter degradans TaxID=2945989 RepID=A0ACC5ZTI4_9RHOB|nr:IclR family transcriptional regulator [Lutimaribacter sp. EGI FJ00013]MCM2561653.1 IclR family transcriptional regulator [Lutimaribacter sp. EGI FJ00013]MCO0612635.1 IclR family transcriptional regulator [Lutimaribacter sp. EGI FJ00015]MCO0635293.1 IclR family transcriptional regulator [Lutimaribacter sp. EGI FJ00014]
MKTKQNTLYVGSLAKGLQLLKAFDESHTDMSLSELAQRTGLNKSATQRLANTLHVEGMLDKDPVTRRFRPSHAWLQLAYAYYWSDPLVGQAMPKLIGLSQELGETVNLAEMSGDHIVYVSRLPCKRTHFAATIIGRRLPALSTAAGRAMLSTFPEDERNHAIETWPVQKFTPGTTIDRDEIRQTIEQAVTDGFSISSGQMLLNETSVASPIIGHEGRAHAAVQCSVSAHTWTREKVEREILPKLQDTANAISPSFQPYRGGTPGPLNGE